MPSSAHKFHSTRKQDTSASCGSPPLLLRRSCNHCRKIRRGCDGQDPCARCTAKGIDCVRGPRRKAGQRGIWETGPRTAGVTSNPMRATGGRRSPAPDLRVEIVEPSDAHYYQCFGLSSTTTTLPLSPPASTAACSSSHHEQDRELFEMMQVLLRTDSAVSSEQNVLLSPSSSTIISPSPSTCGMPGITAASDMTSADFGGFSLHGEGFTASPEQQLMASMPAPIFAPFDLRALAMSSAAAFNPATMANLVWFWQAQRTFAQFTKSMSSSNSGCSCSGTHSHLAETVKSKPEEPDATWATPVSPMLFNGFTVLGDDDGLNIML